MKTFLLTLLFSTAFFITFSQVRLDSGLVAYYPFNGSAKDSTGHGNNPVFNNATLTSDASGRPNSAYHFNGSSSYMQMPNSTSLNMNTTISICAYVKPTGFYTGPCRANAVLQKGDNDNTFGNYALRFSDTLDPCGNPSTTDEHFYGPGFVHAPERVQINTWYHVVWTYDGTIGRIYINGSLVSSVTSPISSFTNNNDLFLGRSNSVQYPFWFNGDLDDVRIYNRALTSQEASSLYSSITAPVITSFSPVSGGTNSSIIITGNNFTGTTSVSFGGVNAASFTVNSDTKITAIVGAGASGSVAVKTPNGTATLAGFVYCLTPSVKITANKTSPVCAGTPVSFTATPANEGVSPVYQWIKNSKTVGKNSPVYIDSSLITGDTVYCILTSNVSPCVTTGTVTSNKLIFTVTPLVTPSVSIMSNTGGLVCAGTNVLFTAKPVNGGSAPVYQWVKNGLNASTNVPTYTDSLAKDGDSVFVKLTTNAACAAVTTVTSNVVKIKVDTPQPVINITANKDTTICASTTVTFTAAVKPSFLWKKNGVVVGDNSNVYVDSTLKTNDNIQSFLVSAVNACNNNSSNILNSNVLKFKVSAPPATPSAISGPTTVPVNYAGAYFSVTAVAGVTYAWTLPSGAVIDSGQGGNKIKVTWGSDGGTVSVIAINSCGASAAVTKSVAIGSTLSLNTGGPGITPGTVTLTSNIKLTPNPARTAATLTFKAIKQDAYSITIADAQYKVLAVKTGVSIKGTNMIKLNVAGYASGMYFVILTNKESGMQSKQLVIGE